MVNIPTESQLRILISGDAADVIAKLEETTGKLIERAVVECNGDHRAKVQSGQGDGRTAQVLGRR